VAVGVFEEEDLTEAGHVGGAAGGVAVHLAEGQHVDEEVARLLEHGGVELDGTDVGDVPAPVRVVRAAGRRCRAHRHNVSIVDKIVNNAYAGPARVSWRRRSAGSA
jgi:hypothetical protein